MNFWRKWEINIFLGGMMKLKSLLDFYDFIEIDAYGNFSLNWKKLFFAILFTFIIITIALSSLFLAYDNIFPDERVYIIQWDSNDTYYNINFNANSNHFGNNFIKGAYLSSSQLGYNHTAIPLNNENKLKYKVNVPDNVTHFVLYIYLEGYFPIPPQYIKMDVTRV